MAKIDASVRTPKVPDYLEATVPGRAKVMRLSLSAFSTEELREVGAQYTEALIDRSEHLLKNGEPTAKPRKSKAAPEGA